MQFHVRYSKSVFSVMPVFLAINEFGNQGEQLPESLAHEANERYTDTLTSAIDISVGYLRLV